ncbi:MAG TPA: PAS domain S-box protein [Gemmatimonadales bacterium]
MAKNGPLRVLLVEDVEDDAELMLRELRRAGEACVGVRVQTEAELIRALDAFAPDVVLSDHSLPDFTARDALHVVERHRPGTPVIIVTGSLDEETAAEYIKAGAADYVVKGRLQRLGPAVRRAMALRQAMEDATRAEQARLRSERRFRKLVEFSSDVITLLDSAGTILYSTQSLKPTLGYELGEKVGQPVFELIHPDDGPASGVLFDEVLARSDRAAKADLRIRHKDGTWRRLEVAATNRLDDPDVGAIVVNYHDVTERKQAEEALREVMDHLRALIQASPLAIYSLTTDARIRTWNAAAERIFGWPALEVIGQPLPIVPDDKEEEQRELDDRVMRGETLSGVAVTRRRRDGKLVQLSMSAGPLFDAAGSITGIMAVSADVTEVRQLEHQYRQAQKMEAVGRLAGGIAHDFNNVLTAIGGYCDLLLEDLAAEDPHREDIREIRKAADRAAALTRQLLAFSRHQVLSPRLVDLNELVADMRSMLERLLGEDVVLQVVPGADLGTVHADPGQLEQVVMNLAVNARDAMPEGGRLTIATADVQLDASYAELHLAAEPGPYVMLAVTDTGTGMDEHTRAHLFEPFFTTKEKGKGTGLGLATVYGIVKQSGGYVWVCSERGKGTTFKVYLPRVAGTDQPAGVAPAEPAWLRGTETILLAEDDATVRTVVREALERLGYTVLEAANAEAAIQAGERHQGPIHLLLTDVVMPAQSGGQLAARLRRARPEMRVLFMSGYPDDAVVRGSKTQPGVTYLQKPFGRDSLARTVRRALGSP